MYKVVYSDGCLRLKDSNGKFIESETELIINSCIDDAKDTAKVTVSFMANISELNKK